MFRNVPRDKLLERMPASVAPVSTKYRPSYSLVENPITRNVQFGDLGQLKNALELQERRIRNKPDLLCSKGADSCFRSVKRVQKHSRKYVEETFRSKVHGHISQRSLEPSASDGEDGIDKHGRAPKIKEPMFYSSYVSPKRSIMGARGSMVVQSDTRMNLTRNTRLPSTIKFKSTFINMHDKA